MLDNKYTGSTEIGWQGKAYFSLDNADKFEKIFTELTGKKPLIPLWILQLRQANGKHTELTLICEQAAVYRYLDSFK